MTYGWRLTHAEDHLKSFLIEQLHPVLGENFSIEDVRVSISNVHLLHLTFADPEKKYSLTIADLRIGFNPLHLLRYGAQARAFSQDLFIKQPRLVIHANTLPDSLQAPLEEQIRHLLERVKSIKFINRLSLLDGEIAYVGLDGKSAKIMRDLEGWMSKTGQDQIDLRLNGQLMDADDSALSVSAQFDLQSGKLALFHALVKRLPLDTPLLTAEIPGLKVAAGLVNAVVDYVPHESPGSYRDIQGLVEVTGLNATLHDSSLILQDGQITLAVHHGKVDLETASALVNQSPVTLTGQIDHWLRPEFHLALSTPAADLTNFKDLLPNQIKSLQGVANVQIALSGNMNTPLCDVAITAPWLRYHSLIVQDVAASAQWRNEQLSIHHIQGSWREFAVEGEGVVSLAADSSTIAASLRVEGSALPIVQKYWPNPLQIAHVDGALRLEGLLRKPKADGRLNVVLTGAAQDSFYFSHRLSIHGSKLQIFPDMGTRSGLTASMDWSRRPASFVLETATMQPWLALMNPDLAEKIHSANFDWGFRVTGTENDFSVSANLFKTNLSANANLVLSVTAAVQRQSEQWQGDGLLILYPQDPSPIAGHFFFSRDSVRWNLRDVVVGEWLAANASLYHQDQRISGACLIQSWPLQRLLPAQTHDVRGILEAEVHFSGTISDPRLQGQLNVNDLNLKQAGPYTTEGAFDWDGVSLNLQRLLVKADDENLLFANGAYHPESDSLNFRLQGTSFEMAKISPAFLPGQVPLGGQTTADIHVAGLLANPVFTGFVRIKQGTCYSIPFDDLHLQLGRAFSLTPYTVPAAKPALPIQRLSVSRKGVFELIATGTYPLTRSDSVAVDIHGTGNFLSILSDINPYFVESNSSGGFNAHVTGLWNRPRFQHAELTVLDGMMKFLTVVPKVTGLKAHLSLEPDHHFVAIDYIEGKIDGHACRISNRLAAADMAVKPLQNLDFEQYGVNFGVLILDTDREGVPLNILGLMERGKYGFVRFRGRTDAERFYVAGPIERPLFRGVLEASNVQFMFPFDESLPMEESNIALEVLFSAEWDVAVRAINEVRYVKSIPGGLDKVYANLKLEEKWGELEFSGQWNDSTFRINGEVRTTSGIIEYLDMNFTIEQGGAQWDRSSLFPIVWGQARTTVTDSVGFTSQIFLTVQTVDQTMDKKPVDDIARQEERLGRWDQIRFKLTSDNPNLGTTEAQLLASLGYSTETLQNKAVDVIGINTENFLLRPIYRPVERTLEQTFRFDYVRFSSRFTRNFLNANLNNNVDLTNRLSLLRSTKLILGKYLAKSVFMQYTGQVETGLEYRYQSKGVGLRHTLGLEYRINPQLLLELEYDYDSLMLYNRDDKRIIVRHWFPF